MSNPTRTWLETNSLCIALSVLLTALALLATDFVGISAVLLTLIFGLVLNPLIDRPALTARLTPGLDFTLGIPLQIGTGLLGLKITHELLELLSPGILLVIVTGVFLTLAVSVIVNRWVKWQTLEAAMTGVSVAICGASALMAMSLVIKKGRLNQQALLSLIMTVIGLSAASMVIYPMMVKLLGIDGAMGGLIMGATIQQISQAVAAGAVFGPDGMAVATMTKMLRVACLVPVMLIFIAFWGRNDDQSKGKFNPLSHMPAFMYLFVVLAVLNIFGFIPQAVCTLLGSLANALILLAVAAIGIKTNLRALFSVGIKPIVLMTIDSLFLFFWVVGGILLLH